MCKNSRAVLFNNPIAFPFFPVLQKDGMSSIESGQSLIIATRILKFDQINVMLCNPLSQNGLKG